MSELTAEKLAQEREWAEDGYSLDALTTLTLLDRIAELEAERDRYQTLYVNAETALGVMAGERDGLRVLLVRARDVISENDSLFNRFIDTIFVIDAAIALTPAE